MSQSAYMEAIDTIYYRIMDLTMEAKFALERCDIELFTTLKSNLDDVHYEYDYYYAMAFPPRTAEENRAVAAHMLAEKRSRKKHRSHKMAWSFTKKSAFAKQSLTPRPSINTDWTIRSSW